MVSARALPAKARGPGAGRASGSASVAAGPGSTAQGSDLSDAAPSCQALYLAGSWAGSWAGACVQSGHSPGSEAFAAPSPLRSHLCWVGSLPLWIQALALQEGRGAGRSGPGSMPATSRGPCPPGSRSAQDGALTPLWPHRTQPGGSRLRPIPLWGLFLLSMSQRVALWPRLPKLEE